MRLLRLLLPLTLAVVLAFVSSPLSPTTTPTVEASAATPDPDHRFGDPVFFPLREPTLIACTQTNCPGPYHNYEAMDLVGDEGDPIYAAGAGILRIGGVVDADYCPVDRPTRGTWVWIDHGPGGQTRYHHLETITAVDGQFVTPATQIGTMGHSGGQFPCEVDYLHFERRASDITTNRLPLTDMTGCAGGTVTLPDVLGEDTWDDLEWRAHTTPALDNSCFPSTWPKTLDQPPSVSLSVDADVSRIDVTVPPRPAAADSVHVRLELFHPSLDAFGQVTAQTIPVGQDVAIFDDLLPNRLYRAFVSFHNDVGWSNWSTPVEAVTGFLPVTPEFREEDSTHTTIGYKWHKGTNADARYTVGIRRRFGPHWAQWDEFEVDPGAIHYRFRGLEQGTTYQVRVQAYTDWGRSGWSNARTLTTLCSSVCDDGAGAAGMVAPDGLECVTISGGSGDAAIVNLTPVEGFTRGNGQLISSDVKSSPPTAANVNFGPGTVDPNVAFAAIGSDGDVCYLNSGHGPVHLVADHLGSIDGGAYAPATTSGAPERKIDTRTGGGAPIAPNAHTCFAVNGDPGDVAIVNLTPVGAAVSGNGLLVSSDVVDDPPTAANVNFGAGTVDPNVAVAVIGSDGEVCFVNSRHGTVHLVADHLGTVDESAYTPARSDGAPDRKLDTRNDGGPISPSGSVCFDVAGEPGDAAIVNLTPVGATGNGNGLLISSDVLDEPPQAANVNFRAGLIDPNVAVAPIGSDGQVCFQNSVHSAVHLVADHLGTIAGSSFEPALDSGAPSRLVDTRG